MSRQIQIRRGTVTQHENFTGAIGELTMDTTNKTLRLHDGTTPGGIILANVSDLPDINTPDADYVKPENVSGLAMPDLESGISLKFDSSLDYAAPCDGFLLLKGDGIAADLYRPNGGTEVLPEYWLSPNYTCNVHPLPCGYRCKYRRGPSEYAVVVFYPCQGCN